MYRSLLKNGYKLHEIDAMDIHFWYELLNEEEFIEEVTADDISWL